uniref:SFRICE_003418 n=1 Tax=Spodoptera frugiperda TaxID=7108 RepID=A0A2H1VQB9_SPOFR
MQCLNTLRACALRLPTGVVGTAQPHINVITKRWKRKSPCDRCYIPKHPKPCFDINSITLMRATDCHAKLIRSFLYTHYWPREPTIISLWMSLDSPLLDVLTDKYSTSGDRLMAFERIKRTGETKLVGLAVASRIYPWTQLELDEWAHATRALPEKYKIYFSAHCLKKSNLFKKYNADYIYDVEILGTASEITGQGVATLLLNKMLDNAKELRHPVVQVVAVSKYATKICEKCGMKLEWSMDYADFTNECGHRIFYPRRPHHSVGVYAKFFDPRKGGVLPCKPQY